MTGLRSAIVVSAVGRYCRWCCGKLSSFEQLVSDVAVSPVCYRELNLLTNYMLDRLYLGVDELTEFVNFSTKLCRENQVAGVL